MKVMDEGIDEMNRAVGSFLYIIYIAFDELGEFGFAEAGEERLLRRRQPRLFGLFVIGAERSEGVHVGCAADAHLYDDAVDIAHWRLELSAGAQDFVQNLHLRQPWRIWGRRCDLRSRIPALGNSPVYL